MKVKITSAAARTHLGRLLRGAIVDLQDREAAALIGAGLAELINADPDNESEEKEKKEKKEKKKTRRAGGAKPMHTTDAADLEIR